MRALILTLTLLLASAPQAATISGGSITGGAIGTASSPPVAGSCTDGVDCYCDTVSDGSLLLCQDFENPDFYETTNWIAGGSDRALGNDYVAEMLGGGTTAEGFWTNGTPASPKLGSTCSPSGLYCGPKEWCSEAQGTLVGTSPALDCWDGNDKAIIDIQRSGDYDAEVSGLTLTGGTGATADVGAGNAHFAYRIPPGEEAGILGSETWSNQTHVGVTELVAYASNVFDAGSNPAGTYWKGDEWGDYPYSEWWMYGNMLPSGSTSTFPFRNFLFTTVSQATCEAAQSAATLSAGSWFGCADDKMYFGADSADYTQSSDWPLGTWACVQGEAIWTGSSPNRKLEMKVWFNETLLIHFSNFDAEILRNNDGYDEFYMNAYSNQNAPGQGTPTTTTSYRYKDNLHIRAGTPVSCASIGF